jgi:hypothetical protein
LPLRPNAGRSPRPWPASLNLQRLRVFSSWLAAPARFEVDDGLSGRRFFLLITASRLSSVAGGQQNSVTPTARPARPRSDRLPVIDGTRLTTAAAPG